MDSRSNLRKTNTTGVELKSSKDPKLQFVTISCISKSLLDRVIK